MFAVALDNLEGTLRSYVTFVKSDCQQTALVRFWILHIQLARVT